MEEGRNTVHMLSRLEVGRLNVHSKPKWCGTINVPVYVKSFLHLHVDTIAHRIEVKHDRLLLESKTLVCLINYRVYVFVDRLFYVDLMTSYLHYMTLNICQCYETLLQLQC